MTSHIVPVRTRSDLRAFVDLPWRIYAQDQYWVPPLRSDVEKFLTPGGHPFLTHAEVQPFLAMENGEVIGRVAAVHNRAHNEFHKDDVGFFGFFESIDREDVAQALLAEVGRWLQGKKLRVIRGPVNLSTNESCGLFIDGRPGSPYVMMPHNPPYYTRLLEEAGFQKAKDLYAMHKDLNAMYLDDPPIPLSVERHSKKLMERFGIRARTAKMKDFEREVDRIFDLYNENWANNWGFVPFSKKEVWHLARDLKPIADPNLVIFLERVRDGNPVGIALGVPDANQVLRHVNGRLFPLGIFKAIWHRRKIDRFRVLVVGVSEELRGKGLDTLLYLALYRNLIQNQRYREAEMSWMLEDNVQVLNVFDRVGAKRYRTYRLYERLI